MISSHRSSIQSANSVFGGEIGVSGLGDRFRGREASGFPVEAPLDHPLQDAWSLRLEAFDELGVALVLRDRHGEWDQVDPSPHGEADAAQSAVCGCR